MVLTSLKQFIEIAKRKPTRRIAVAAAEDEPVLRAIKTAYEIGLVIPVLIGDEIRIKNIADKISLDLSKIELIHCPDNAEASRLAVKAVCEGGSDFLMKGLVATVTLLRSVVHSDLVSKGALLSHFAISEYSGYHKLIGLSDGAMNIKPDLDQKVSIINNSVNVLRALGYDCPKVAVISPAETVNSKMESSMDAAMLSMMNRRGQIKGCLVDGPLALDNAISKDAAIHKGIISDVAGDADILIMHDLDSGNTLYKAINFLVGANSAGIIAGAKVPIVLTSRADSEVSKTMSIALAAALIK